MISSGNVTKWAGNYGFTEEIINGRRHFLCNATYTFFTVNLFKPVIIKFKMRFQPQ